MSILIQFVKDNLFLFVSAVISVVLLIGAIVALIIVNTKVKRAQLSSQQTNADVCQETSVADASTLQEENSSKEN